FSFGCVLFEMLTGRQAFHGESASEIIASVLVRDPDFALLPESLNPRLHELVRRCLNKNPKRRWQAVADLRMALETIAQAPRRQRETAAVASRGTRERVWILAFALAATSAAIFAFLWSRPSPSPDELRLDITAPPTPDPISLAVAPDGKRVAFVGFQQGKPL